MGMNAASQMDLALLGSPGMKCRGERCPELPALEIHYLP
jgi:hypothetical protein